ncbi:MAG: DNA alkylation repair protein [Treponema sp.]|jgi:3-methyladenine DNA glycosylase AlkC|nr:DNA alkylation repair protein [Treponema sp.]
MAEPLKNVYNLKFLQQLGAKIQRVYGAFDVPGFIKGVLGREWKTLALKERMRKISETLGAYLPPSYEDALGMLLLIAEDCTGFPYLIFPDFVALHGLDKQYRKLSLKALELFTQQSSAEFAIRPFIKQDPEGVMKQMSAWARHKNEHVRRLSSEGCRPRLPWGESLPVFKKDPAPVLAVLEQLKADPSLYVRKSVANNLNDISKDHPGLVLETAKRWKGQNPDTDWIIRRGCRGLIRQGDAQAYALFDYDPLGAENPGDQSSLISAVDFSLMPGQLRIGDRGELCYAFTVREGDPVRLRVEYGVDFVRAGGRDGKEKQPGQEKDRRTLALPRVSRKLFVLLDKTVEGGVRVTGKRVHKWADLNTRRHYPGDHGITLLVNGREIARGTLKLLPGEKS